VIAQPRGSAKSEGHYGHEDTDHYDLIEWITQQQWSNGKVGIAALALPANNGVPLRRDIRAESHLSVRRVQRIGGMFGSDFNPVGAADVLLFSVVFSTVPRVP
jgi:hypothetical protein